MVNFDTSSEPAEIKEEISIISEGNWAILKMVSPNNANIEH